MNANQGPVAFPVGFFASFDIHPTTSVYQIAEHINESFFNHFFGTHNRFSVPAKCRQGFLRLLQLAMQLLRLRRPLLYRGCYGRAELQSRTQRCVCPGEACGREVLPAKGRTFCGTSLGRHVHGAWRSSS